MVVRSLFHENIKTTKQASIKAIQLCGAEEACWAHNPKVRGSKPRGAILLLPFFYGRPLEQCPVPLSHSLTKIPSMLNHGDWQLVACQSFGPQCGRGRMYKRKLVGCWFFALLALKGRELYGCLLFGQRARKKRC
eukprot:scaffold397_cov111-Cylindrotheca_fusiformis.AAC.10